MFVDKVRSKGITEALKSFDAFTKSYLDEHFDFIPSPHDRFTFHCDHHQFIYDNGQVNLDEHIQNWIKKYTYKKLLKKTVIIFN